MTPHVPTLPRPMACITSCLLLCLLLIGGTYSQTPAVSPNVTFAWETDAAVSMFHRYCFDPAQGTKCSSGTLRPLADVEFDIVAIMPSADITADDRSYLQSRNQSRPFVVVALGLPPDGTSVETFLKHIAEELAPSLILYQEQAFVAGFGTYLTDAEPVGGDILGSVPVAGFVMNPTWIMETGSVGMIPASALPFMDSNLWEDAFSGFTLTLGRLLFVMVTYTALCHGVIRIVHSFQRDLPMKIFPLTLRSSRPIALWTNVIGVTGRLLFMMIDPMSAQFRISSSLSGIIGVFGVPWTIVTAVIAIGAWLYSIRRKINEDVARVRRYQIIGIVFASIIILLSLVSMVVEAAKLNSLKATGTIYFLAYCVALALCGLIMGIVLVRIYRLTKNRDTAKASTAARSASSRTRVIKRGIIFTISTFLVLLSFLALLVPTIVAYPVPYVVSSTVIAWTLAFCSAAGVELFDYRPKSERSTRSGSDTSSGPTVSTLRMQSTVNSDTSSTEV